QAFVVVELFGNQAGVAYSIRGFSKFPVKLDQKAFVLSHFFSILDHAPYPRSRRRSRGFRGAARRRGPSLLRYAPPLVFRAAPGGRAGLSLPARKLEHRGRGSIFA